VLAHRPEPVREVYVRLETLPGEQSQVDWAHVGHIRVKGGVRALYCFVLLLRYSRVMWAELVLEQTTASLLRSLMRAAQYFDGVTHQWLFDNPKSIVAAREGSAIRFQPDLVELAGALHVSLRATLLPTQQAIRTTAVDRWTPINLLRPRPTILSTLAPYWPVR
jgi:transposase